MADNLVEKILKDHVESGTYEQGEEVGLRIDQCLLQDATGTMACLQLEQMGVDRVQVPLAVQYVDHNIIQIAIGVGGLDVSLVMAGNPFNNAVPTVVGVELTGELQDWVTPKDVILELLRRRDVDGGAGRIFEFYGPGVETIPVEGRMTICNIMIRRHYRHLPLRRAHP